MIQSNIWKFLILSVALSTWMRRDAILLVAISSFSDNYFLPHKKEEYSILLQ